MVLVAEPAKGEEGAGMVRRWCCAVYKPAVGTR